MVVVSIVLSGSEAEVPCAVEACLEGAADAPTESGLPDMGAAWEKHEGLGSAFNTSMAFSFLDASAIFTITVGPGTAMSCYGSLVGWYEHALGSKEMIVWMRIAVFAPYPAMLFLQSMLDAHFDRVYGIRRAYLCRLVIGQLAVASVMGLWMRLPNTLEFDGLLIPCIVGFGVFLGAILSPSLGSAVKLAAAMDPGLVVWATLGNTVGNAIPVVGMKLLRFSPHDSHSRLCEVLFIPVSMCTIGAVLLAVAFEQGFFDAALAKLSPASHPDAKLARMGLTRFSTAGISNVPSGGPLAGSHQAAGTGGTSDDERIPTAARAPTWIWVWLGAQSAGHFIDFVLLALISYFGDEFVTHQLAGLVFVAGSVGRMLPLLWQNTTRFQSGPLHSVNACSFILRVALASLLGAALLGKAHLGHHALVVVWSCFFANSMMQSSLTDMTTTMYSPASLRNDIAHRGLVCVYASIFGALSFSAVLAQTKHLKYG